MNQKRKIKKSVSLVIVLLIILSSFGVVSAANYDKENVGKNAQIIDSGATLDKMLATASNNLNINGSSSWGLKWKSNYNYTNAVTGAKETLYGNQYINYHTYNYMGSSKKYTCWCIQPYLNINNNGNYKMIDNGGNKAYWNKLSGTDIQKSIAKVIAFGKKKMQEKSSNNNEYYFAVQILAWEFIMGIRGANNYSSEWKSKARLTFPTTEKANKFLDAYKYILECMNTDVESITDGMYKTMNGASSASKKLLLDYTEKKATYSDTVTVSGIKKGANVKYSIVNNEDKKPQDDKMLTLTVNKSKKTFTVKQSAKASKTLYDLKQSGTTYYVKAEIDDVPEYSSSDSNVILQNTNKNSQTLAQSMKFSINPPVRYFAIDAKKNPPTETTPTTTKYGSFKINKKVETKSGKPYEDDLSGWIFGVEDETNHKNYLLTTNEDGETTIINNIPLGHMLYITEYGKEMPKYYDELEWHNIKTIGSEYGLSKDMTVGMPQRWAKKAGQSVRQTIEEEDLYEFDVTNEYSEEISLNISKVVDDDSTLAGYYFYVFNAGLDNLLNRPTIVGPTNNKGECPELLTDNTNDGTIGIIELGFLKEGQVIYTKHPTLTDFVNQNWRDKFEIPSKFDKQVGNYNITGFSDAVPFTIYKRDIANHYKDIVISNTTSGYLTITKKDKSTNAPIKDAVYGLYNKSQPLTDNTSYDDNSSSSGSSSDNTTVVDESEGKEDNENYSEDTSLVCTLTTDENGNATTPLIRTGKYILKEISVDKTHYIDDTEYEVEITPGSNTLSTAVKKELKDEPTNINFYKTEKSTLSTNGGNVKGAHIKIYEKPASGTINYNTAKVITEFDTTTTQKVLTGIFERGKTYLAHETKTPDGYVTASDVEFTIPNKKDTSKEKVKMEDGTTNIEVYKKNADGSKNLSGCTLQVKDSNNKVIDSWVTTTSAHKIEGKLVVGKTYTLSEIKPAPGYTTAKSISFTVKNTTAAQTVTMTDVQTSFEIYKKNANTSKNISGCVLEVRDSNKNVIDSWTTTASAHKIVGKLVVGQTYTLVETKPAPGYTTAKSIDFTVKDTTDVQTVTMEDVQTLIKVFKKNANNGRNLSGCKLAVKDKNNNIIDSWTTTSSAHEITGLTVGQTYTLYEVEPAPGYVTARNITFTVEDTSEAQEVTMNDNQTTVTVHKKNKDGSEYVGGCTLNVRNSQGNIVTVITNTSNTKAETIKGVLVVGETYTIEEIKSGNGYATTTNKTFTVLDTAENQNVYMYDDTIKVKFSKTTITGTEELEGCKLMLVDAQSGGIIDSWTSTNEPHMIEKRLVVGKSYILKETKPADGYVTATDVTFTVKDTGEIQTVEMKDDTTKVKVSKQDITNNQELAGCSLKIIDTTNDKVIEEWISTTTPHMIEGKLVAGRKYILSEVKAVKGYATADDVEFTVKDSGEIQTVEMKDEPIKVKLSKRVITGESELPGCELEVKDKDNKTIDSWTSTATPHIINKLTVGQSYKLIETKAVNGYATTESINFTIADTGEVQNVEPMRDDTTKVQISKIDIATKQELPDCELQLLDKTDNNREIAKWTTTKDPRYIEGQLVVGHTYTLVELRPAQGFTTAESIDFTVEDTAEIQKVQMIDGNTRVQFSKTDLTGEKEIPGCLLSLTDEADNKEIERWTTTDTPHLIEGKLVAGHTYILKELNPAKGYVTAANIKYKVKDTTALQVVEPMKDDVTKISFTKTDITGQKEIPDCKLELKDADSNIIESWTSTNKAHVITGKLEVGKTYILTEKYPADGYATAKDVTFKVEDTGNIQPVNMKDEITKVSISKRTITGDDELAGCNLEVRNENNDLIDSWTSTNEQHLIKGLTINKTYTLSETKPADGYTTATDISFTVNDTGDVQYITPMRDDTTKVKISKVDITNQQELAGCHLKIVDKTKDNEDVESWVSTDAPHYIEGKLVVGHTYTLIETKPADGFTTAESVDFTIKDSGEVQTVKMEDNKTKVAFSKTDITGEKEIAGCELKLTDKTDGDKEVAKWVSTETPHEIDGQLIVGHTYVLTETRPADGFVTAESVKFTVADTTNEQKVTMKDDTVKVELSKTDITGKKEIPDCKLKLIDKADNKEIDSWTSTDTPHYIEGKLVVGKTYILSETYPADGYATATDVEFTVDDKGSVQKVSMKDDTIKVALSKTDITGQKELPNCTLEVTDEEGFIVDNWVSTDTPHLIEGKLIAGKTYTLTERKPADGYATAEDIKFTVRDTGEIQNITPMKDDTIKCSFSKTDITGEKELAGCNLVLTDKADGKKIDSWTSSDTPHIIEGKLVAGKTYILSETKPADGYTTAENVEFTVSDTGKVQDVQMKDDTTKVQISKVDITGEKELAGCSLELTDNNTKEIVDQWVSADTPHYIEGKLIVGHEYTLKETNPAEGYVTASDVIFTVKDNNEIQKVQMKDGKTKVSFSKQSLTDSKKIEGCSLVVTDADNNSVIDEWISTTTPHIIEGKLVAGKTYILTETNPAKGYVTAESVKFTVADTTNEQKVTMKDDVTKVEFSKTDITNSKEIKGCILEITDTDGNSLYSWTSSNKPHVIKGQLEINKTYYLIEKTPAKGYTTAEKVEFKVDDTGDIQHVEMKDAPTNIEIHKLASHDKSLLLGGANLKVYNKKHKSECYKFITTEGKPYSIVGKLKVGDTYVVEETKAPNGYKLAKPITFKVKDTGEVQIINMYDKKIKPVAPVTGDAANNFVWLAVLLGLVGVGFLIIPVKKKFFGK